MSAYAACCTYPNFTELPSWVIVFYCRPEPWTPFDESTCVRRHSLCHPKYLTNIGSEGATEPEPRGFNPISANLMRPPAGEWLSSRRGLSDIGQKWAFFVFLDHQNSMPTL